MEAGPSGPRLTTQLSVLCSEVMCICKLIQKILKHQKDSGYKEASLTPFYFQVEKLQVRLDRSYAEKDKIEAKLEFSQSELGKIKAELDKSQGDQNIKYNDYNDSRQKLYKFEQEIERLRQENDRYV